MTIPADALYQHFLVTAERRFWRGAVSFDLLAHDEEGGHAAI